MNRASSATGWVRNPDGTLGWTWNPITGCLNGCEYCYARRLANGRLKSRYLANMNFPPIFRENLSTTGNNPFYPRFWRDRLDDLEIPPKKRDWQKPKGIFVCDMGELFGDWLPTEWVSLVFYMMALNLQHRFYLLTKQPQNLIKWSPFPDNCWVGVTATNLGQYKQALAGLAVIEAKVKYISFEPLLEDIGSHIYPERLGYVGLNWIIVGAQTKPYKPPQIEWVEEIVRACDRARIPVFLKDNLSPILPMEEPFYKKLGEGAGYISYSLNLRQELPK